MLLLLISGGVLVFARKNSSNFLNLYKIEISRVENELEAAGASGDGRSNKTDDALIDSIEADDGRVSLDLSRYETITGVYLCTDENRDTFYSSNNNYHIADVGGKLYRIEYAIDLSKERSDIYRSALVTIGAILGAVILVLVYIYIRIITVFNNISEYPVQLAKGNLSIPLMEERNKYFGKFLWGLDMLREKLEDEKRRNLELEKEKNVFLLSLSHDMKTPISAIKLYAAALRKNLYKDEEKLCEVGEKIEDNAGEIEKYVARIISSSGDDFLDLSVKEDEFYLSEAVNYVKEYYEDKLKPLGTDFVVEKYSDLILRGDRDRLIEVLQNLMENAIKYGDGGHIKISFDDEEDARLVTVTNSGCTLPESEGEHIFESFYRGTNVGSKPGSGLGLYISKKLMEKMGGEIFSSIDGGDISITLVLHRVR